MKEIGIKLHENREAIGVTIEEVSEDLKVKPSLIEAIEEGDIKAFEDIFMLKSFISDYAKYLGLDPVDLVDEFNEYLFDYTSQLSLDDIKKAKKVIDPLAITKKEKQIKSPYTLEPKEKKNIKPYIITFLVISVLIGGVFVAYTLIKENNSKNPVINKIG